MSATEIPPKASPQPPEGDLYDARRWESAYTELHAAPALLIQMQDDLARSRMREAFWMSVVFHLLVVITLWNSARFAKWIGFDRRALLVNPAHISRNEDLTYLQLPPDAQKVTKRPNTNIISDKDRIATSKQPQLDAKELRKILDSGLPGLPKPPAVPAQNAQANPPAAEKPPAPQQEQAQNSQPPPANNNQEAKMQAPVDPKIFSNPGSAGSEIESAARATAGNRGGYGGDNGDYGLGIGKQPGAQLGPMDVLSDTMGVDFGPYLARVLHDVRLNWYNIIPEVARAPIMKKGKVTIEFAITKDGRIAGLQRVLSSGDVALDRAALGGISASNPFPPLPSEFGGDYLALRFHFYYNPDKAELE